MVPRGTGMPLSESIILVSFLLPAVSAAISPVSEVSEAWIFFWFFPSPSWTRL